MRKISRTANQDACQEKAASGSRWPRGSYIGSLAGHFPGIQCGLESFNRCWEGNHTRYSLRSPQKITLSNDPICGRAFVNCQGGE